MAFIRSTLQKVLDFHMQNLVRSWQYATLDKRIWHPDAQQQHANTTLESAPARPWRLLNRTSSWLKPAKQNTASIFDTPRTMLQACNNLCLTCNEQEHLIIWCRGCNFGECKLCVDTRGYLRCLCSVDNIQLTTDAAMRNGIYAHQLNSASMMIINRSKAVLVESENSGAGTVLDLPETLFAVNDDGELTHLEPICKDLQLPLDCSAFRFPSLDPCIIIANTGNFSTDQLGNLEWISINLMRDPFMKQNDLMTVVMTTLAVGLKAGLMRALDNWWLKLADSRELVGLMLRVHCIQGLITEGMKQCPDVDSKSWMVGDNESDHRRDCDDHEGHESRAEVKEAEDC